MTSKQYWFPAKRYGWGWGLPRAWQGKAVLIAFFVLVAAGAVSVLPHYGNTASVVYGGVLCCLLVAVCWFEGEPPGRHKGGG
ncbi:MAG: hypothetical protein EG826_16565 [Deltaproteobacteria bacterium]|nr:hypothetical protein [Deltaproteobacteria bacterium]